MDAQAAAGSESLEVIIKVFADGARSRDADSTGALGWQFAQFIVGAIGASAAISRYELNEAGDWLAWSLTDFIERGPVQHLNVVRLEAFLHPMISSWAPFADVYMGWFCDFYYYARRRSAMPEIAEAILPLALGAVQMMWKDDVSEGLARTASNMLAWSAQEFPEAASRIAPLIEGAARDPGMDGRVRLILAMTLAGKSGELVGMNTQQWRALALNDLSAWHRGHDRLQLLVDELGSRDDQSLFEEVIQEIDKHQSWARGHVAHDVDMYRGLDALAPLIKVALHSCLSRHQGHRLVELLAHWYRVPSDEALDARYLLIQCPFYSDGYMALVGSDAFHIAGDPQNLLVDLTQASNQFLGTYDSVTGGSGAPHVPDRPGVVDESAGARFEVLLSETYLPARLASQDWTFSGQIVVPSKGHPIQAIQLRSGAPSAPIVASLRKPYPDREVHRVAIWSGAGSMTEEIERDAVASTFRRGGVEVEVVAPGEATVNGFLDLYEADVFDVVWLMSHGNFDHYSPKRASLVVDEKGGEIGISELLRRTPMGMHRRLCVLNVCDGGRFEELGVLPRVGVAPSAASACQATISHLWPVHGISAAAFGVILAKHLVSRMSYFDAFAQTLRDLNASRADVAELLRSAAGQEAEQLVDRIERSNIDLTNIAHWGSAVFYA